MELRIDLSDRTEIAAAIALLGAIIGEAATETSGYIAPARVEFNGTQDGTLGNVPAHLLADAPSGAGASPLSNVPEGLLGGAQTDTSGSTSPVAPTGQAPADAPSAPAAPGNHVQLDKEGIPHDTRIHSNPPSINKGDGMWRAKKGLNDEALVNRVKAELKALMAIPSAGGAVAGASNPAAPAGGAAPSASPSATPPAVPPAPTAPPAAEAPAAPPAAVTDVPAPTTPQELIPRVTAANASGVLPQSALLDACTAYQLPNIPALFQRPDKVPEVYAYLTMAYPNFK